MTSDSQRVQNSAFVSLSFHGLVFGSYLLLKTTQTQNEVLLTHIELMDLRPQAEAEAMPAQRAPRGMRDFLRMALPVFKPSQEQETQPAEAPKEINPSSPRMQPEKRIQIDAGRTLQHGSIQFKAGAAPRASDAAFSDIETRAASRQDAGLAPLADKPSLSLEPVGRKAMRGASASSIRIDPGAAVARGGTLSDLNTSRPYSGGNLAQGPGGGQIQLDAGGAGPRRSGRMPSSLPIGYGEGGGSGITLRERPLSRGGGGGLPSQDLEQPAPAAKLETKAEKHNKAVEISGPLAHRKVVNLYLPSYPDWAKARGVEAEVVIRFFVSAQGEVRDRLILERTSGYRDLDQQCMDALKKWVFVALPAGSEEADQWGIITFRFRLK